MLLCDIGNTSYHFFQTATDHLEERAYKENVQEFNPSSLDQTVYFICVNQEVKSALQKLPNWIDLSEYVDMKSYYETMGVDRIFACEAIKDGVIVDAGSAITVDVVEDGKFRGGFIYPGTKAMRECYRRISPALDYEFNFELDTTILPKNSQDAISYGYLKILQNEVLLHKKNIYLTGGDAQALQPLFKDALLREELIFDGMKKVISQSLWSLT